MEVRRHLAAKGIDEATTSRALRELERQGYLDDTRYARRFTEDRRALDDWGAERIERKLLAAGIAPDVADGLRRAEAAIAGGAASATLDALVGA